MPWPDIFFPKKAKLESAPPPVPKPVPANVPTVKPVPAAAKPAIGPGPTAPLKTPVAAPVQPPSFIPPERSTRTIPAMHGVVLRPPSRLNTTTQISPNAPAAAPTPPPEPIRPCRGRALDRTCRPSRRAR